MRSIFPTTRAIKVIYKFNEVLSQMKKDLPVRCMTIAWFNEWICILVKSKNIQPLKGHKNTSFYCFNFSLQFRSTKTVVKIVEKGSQTQPS